MLKLCSSLLAAMLGCMVGFAPDPAWAGVIPGDFHDRDIREDGVLQSESSGALLPGSSGNPGQDRSSVYVFQLPDLGAVADPFNSATIRFKFSGTTGNPPNLDLYGLGRRASPLVVAGDYYGETTVPDATDATFLQNNILTSGTATGLISSNTTGGTALTNYLNAQYAGGAGIGQYVFLRLSSDTGSTSVNRYSLSSADSGATADRPQILYNVPSGFSRPFIWVRDSEKAGILDKIATRAWATTLKDGMVSRVAADLASHKADRDAFIRGLPVEWNLSPAKFKTIPAYSESSVRFPAEAKFNDAVDCAVLYYLTGNQDYARLAADVLHNAVQCLLEVAPSTSVGNGGWIFRNDFLKEARVTGTQLPIVYDFLYSYLQTQQVYDVQAAGMVNFNFTDAQDVFRTLYELSRDHGSKDNNWSALMATCMLNSILALDNTSARAAALQVYLTTGSSRQASLDYDYRYYTQPIDVWPESLQYAGAVGNIRTSHMVLLERVYPDLDLFGSYPNLPLSLPRISDMRYPNGEQISFGDGHRSGSNGPFSIYEMVYQHAVARGKTSLSSFFGELINGGVADGNHNRASLSSYSSLGQHNEPLELLWAAADISEAAVTPPLPRTDALPFAGITLQRNPAPTNDPNHGLMCFVGGAGHVHSHASGMSMELYGVGQVMGAKSGASTYGSSIHENYYRVAASNNTVIVNGGSRGQGGWADIEINTVQTVAMEPQPFAEAVSPEFSFTCSSFADDKGTLAEGTQQRTMAIVRTSPTSGFYVDVFRSKSTVTNRTATTLNGNVTNQYHDYIYRNIGEAAVDLRADGSPLPLVSQPNRFQNDIGDAYDQPGWRYFTNTEVSYPTSQSVTAQFVANVSGTPRYMDMHLPAVASREVAKVDSPAIVDAPGPYDKKVAPTLVVRQIGEAWDKAFAVVYEPHFGSSGNIQNVTRLVRSGVVVGVKVESLIAGKPAVHYIISNPGDGQTYEDASVGLSFTGRFGIVADYGAGDLALYLGQGSSLIYAGNSVATASGSSSEANVRLVPGQAPVVTGNAPVDVVVNPRINASWLPTVGSPALAWNHTSNWNPAAIPNGPGRTTSMDIDLSGDQTIALDTPITLARLVIGDTDGDQKMVLQKGVNGSLVFEEFEDPMAFLLRGAGGTGDVTLDASLDITLKHDLTVGLAGGAAISTMRIGGEIGGTGKGLIKESDGLSLVLSGDSSFSGTTVINGGMLQLGDAGATGGLRGTSGITLTDGVLVVNRSNTFTQATDLNSKPIKGAGGFTQRGTGTTVLSMANSYAGPTTISAGVLQLGASEVIPDGGGVGNLIVDGTLDLNGFSEGVNRLTGSGVVDTVSGGSPTFAVGHNDQSGTFDGVLRNTAGELNLEKVGGGTLVLGGVNTFSGSVTVSAGTLAFAKVSPLENVSGITLAGGTTLRPDVVGGLIDAPISVGATGTTVTINAPSIVGGGGTSPVPLTLGGVISGAGNVTFRGIQNNNAYGRIILNGASSYAGSTLLTTNGSNRNLFVALGTDNALPVTTVLTLDGDDGAGSGRYCELSLNGHDQMLAGLTNVAGRMDRSQRIVNPSPATATLTVNNTSDFTYSAELGRVSGYGSDSYNNLNLTKSGLGSLTLAGPLRYSGDTHVSGGTLILGSTNPNNDFSTILIAASGAVLQLNHAGSDTVAALVIGSTTYGSGEYGHTNSGVDNGGLGVGALNAYFAPGAGSITVVGLYQTWAASNAGGQDADLDWDQDGVENGVEYFMNAAAGFTANPTLDAANTITWPNGGNLPASAYGTQFVVQTSPDLSEWTDVPAGDLTLNTDGPGGSLTYTLTGLAPRFVRLEVTPN